MHKSGARSEDAFVDPLARHWYHQFRINFSWLRVYYQTLCACRKSPVTKKIRFAVEFKCSSKKSNQFLKMVKSAFGPLNSMEVGVEQKRWKDFFLLTTKPVLYAAGWRCCRRSRFYRVCGKQIGDLCATENAKSAISARAERKKFLS